MTFHILTRRHPNLALETRIEYRLGIEAAFESQPDERDVRIGGIDSQSLEMFHPIMVDKLVEVLANYLVQRPGNLIRMDFDLLRKHAQR